MVRYLYPNNEVDGIGYGYECVLDDPEHIRAGQRGVTIWGPASTFEIGPNNRYFL
jgi:hypothetical protein